MRSIYHRNTTRSNTAHLILELRDELLVTRQDIRAVLDEAAEGPQPESGLAVLLDDVEVGPVWAPTHLPRLRDDSVDALAEGVVEHRQRCL